MDELSASLSMLTNGDLMGYFLKGVVFTLVIAVVAVIVGFVSGTLLALIRNFCNTGPARVLRWLSVAYIEVFRNTPLPILPISNFWAGCSG